MKFFDKANKRLIIFAREATPEYWDRHWQKDDTISNVKSGKGNRLVKKFTSKFLKPGARILEGGCGIGQNVYGLKNWGYDAYGVDFTVKTVERIKKELPELKISVQDVRKLNFPAHFFDGYWSLGVIEHCQQGYSDILKEIKRVIKPGGYLFLTFPYMSPLRKIKAMAGLYKIFKNSLGIDNFYEFILDDKQVKKEIERCGFKLCQSYPLDATKGIKDEVSFLQPVLQKIYNSKKIAAKLTRFLNSILFSKIASHMILLVFQKSEE